MSLNFILFIFLGFSSLLCWWAFENRRKWKDKAKSYEIELEDLRNDIRRYKDFYGKISEIHKESKEDDNKSIHDLTNGINSTLSMR